MKKKKTIMMVVVVLLLVIVSVIGASYAYFATVNKTTGNDKDLNIVTEDLGNIKWEGTKVYTSGDLLPGECGIQTFTIEKNSASGKGIYEIDLKGILDESFGTDVEITLYKSTDTTTNNVTIKEGNSTISGDTTKKYYKEDSVVLNGTPKKVYGSKSLQNNDKIILEQADFDNSTLQKTTYYLVYCYKNNGDQDAQQGKSFSGEISVRLILEKGIVIPDIIGKQLNDGINLLSQVDDSNFAKDLAGNTRYIGANPNNYVSVDGEVWRIIGVMKNIDDGTGNKSDRVKLIRNESIGNYSWDTSIDSINSGLGVNEWSQADLMKLLNPGYESESVGGSLYWNSGSGWCYGNSKNRTTSCNFMSIGIKTKLKSLIGNAVWNTGAPAKLEQITSKFYTDERGNGTGKSCTSGYRCSDTVKRTTTWKGKVGLMYLSDYGYATSGGSATNRAKCLNTDLYSWEGSSVSDCKNNDWLYNSTDIQWSLSPCLTPNWADCGFGIDTSGRIGKYIAWTTRMIRPSVYLLPSVKISSGTGSYEDPFILEN